MHVAYGEEEFSASDVESDVDEAGVGGRADRHYPNYFETANTGDEFMAVKPW